MGSFFSLLRRILGCQFADSQETGSRSIEEPTSRGAQYQPLASRSTTHTSLSAVIIGIDKYRDTSITNLFGAVADAKEFETYLLKDLRVSNKRIRTLYNLEATREAIIAAFEALRDDEHINKGDPILIYFAGHGGEIPTPPGWGHQERVQCIMPQDYEATKIEPIPDRTIGALIERIANAKGNNIVVVFDCCHSGSGTRDKNMIARTANLDINIRIPETLDNDIWGNRAGVIPNGFTYHGLRSHVLLAACNADEFAYEQEGRGRFTRALLTVLRKYADDELSYAEVLDSIRLEKQTPQCEGANRHRSVFSTTVPGSRRVLYPVQVDTNKYVIGAGSAHGVSYGAEFTLFRDRKVKLGVVLVDDASSIDSFNTTITLSKFYKLHKDASFAKLTHVGNLPLYLSQNQRSVLEGILRRSGKGDNAQTFRIVDNVKEAKLELAMEGDRVIFRVTDERVKAYGLTELPYRVHPDNLSRVLSAAAQYFWYLDLKGPNSVICTSDDIGVNFYLLKEEHSKFGIPILSPVEPGFCKKDGHLDVIDFDVDTTRRYGIEIKNKTPRDLYLNAFLFNNSGLSISPFYVQPSAGNPEAPLKQNGTFTIGYGTGGRPPFSYKLEEGQNVDVGYLKIFFATRAIDLSDVKQDTPFLDTDSSLRPRDGNPNAELHGAVDIEFTVQIPVVQRRMGN